MKKKANLDRLVRIDIRIPHKTARKIEEVAIEEALSRSALVRSLIVKGLRNYDKSKEV